jgi:uncharacterized protein YndB with AHSA1/START domain
MHATHSLDTQRRAYVMAVVTCHINATPDAVFAVLADGWLYSNWVVGASHVRAVEDGWPAVGSRLHHASGVWPIVARDETAVEEVDPGRLLVLLPKGRPLGEARVRIELESSGGGTELTMWETPVAGPGKWLNNPITESVLKLRNVEALSRLTALVERRTEPSDV